MIFPEKVLLKYKHSREFQNNFNISEIKIIIITYIMAATGQMKHFWIH